MANETKMTGAQGVVACLESAGVERVFGYPGGQALRLFDALRDSGIEFVLARHEQAAVHEADGYARASGRAGVVLVTSGPGATNTVTGIATAYMDSIPLVVITAQVPTGVIGTDSFQESDIFGITLPVVKHSYLLRNADELPETFAEAFHIASTGRPGPVLVDVPSDVAAAEISFAWPEKVNVQSYKPTIKGNQKQVRTAARYLSGAKRPLVIAGGGVLSANASAELGKLVDMLQLPVVTTLMGKTAISSDNPLNLGAVGMHGSKYANEAVSHCDLLLCAGTHLSDRVTGRIEDFAPQADLIHIDIDPAEIGKVKRALVPVVGDLRYVLADIIEALEHNNAAPSTSEWIAQIEGWKERWPFFDTAVVDDAEGIVPEKLMKVLSDKLCSSDNIVCTDVGKHQMWAHQFLARKRPRTFLTSGGLGTMGFGFPAAIGAAMAEPGACVVCITGDGSFQMNLQEMATAAEHGVNVKVLVMNNSSLGMVHQWQEMFYGDRTFGTVFGYSPDLCKLADAYGWRSACVSDEEQLDEALEAMLAGTGPFLLEVKVPVEAKVYPMTPPGEAISDTIGAIDMAVGAVRTGLPSVSDFVAVGQDEEVEQ